MKFESHLAKKQLFTYFAHHSRTWRVHKISLLFDLIAKVGEKSRIKNLVYQRPCLSKRLKTVPCCQWRCVDVEWRRLRWRPTFHDEPLYREAFPPIRCPLVARRVSTWGEGAALTAGIAGAPCWRQTLWWHCQVPWLEPLEVREPRRQTLAFEDTLGTSVHKVDRLAYVLLVSKVVSCPYVGELQKPRGGGPIFFQQGGAWFFKL